MSSGSAKSSMDALKAKNLPPALATPQEPVVRMVQMTEEEWMRLSDTVQRLEALTIREQTERRMLEVQTRQYTERMQRAAQDQTESAKAAIRQIQNEAMEQVGRASAKAFDVIDKRIARDEMLWWLRLALTALPVILVLLLWVCLGFKLV